MKIALGLAGINLLAKKSLDKLWNLALYREIRNSNLRVKLVALERLYFDNRLNIKYKTCF